MSYYYIGYVGAFLYMLGYFLLVLKLIPGNGLFYLLLNLFAPIMVIISLYEQPNGPSLFIQSFFALMSLLGLIQIKFPSLFPWSKKRSSPAQY